jgi:hypothetical protein
VEGRRLLLGEAKWHDRPLARSGLDRALRELAARLAPALPAKFGRHEVWRVLFVPELNTRPPSARDGVIVVTGSDLLGSR